MSKKKNSIYIYIVMREMHDPKTTNKYSGIRKIRVLPRGFYFFWGPLRALPNMLTYICYNMVEHVIIQAIIYILMCIS